MASGVSLSPRNTSRRSRGRTRRRRITYARRAMMPGTIIAVRNVRIESAASESVNISRVINTDGAGASCDREEEASEEGIMWACAIAIIYAVGHSANIIRITCMEKERKPLFAMQCFSSPFFLRSFFSRFSIFNLRRLAICLIGFTAQQRARPRSTLLFGCRFFREQRKRKFATKGIRPHA